MCIRDRIHAEWEYAARAGTETRFAQGDELTAAQANFSRAATENLRQLERPEGMPELVNRDQPVRVNELDAVNGWGLRHMSGNVRELTVSCWTEQQLGLAKSSAYLQRSLTETSCRRVAKGGAFSSAKQDFERYFSDANAYFRCLDEERGRVMIKVAETANWYDRFLTDAEKWRAE